MTVKQVSAYWDARPCNVRHSNLDINVDPLGYSKSVTQRKYFVEPHIWKLAQFGRWEGRKVLDFGCGIGTDALQFARAGADVTAMDVSAKSLAIAAQRARAEDIGIFFLLGDIEYWQAVLLNARFDLVYSFGVIHHTPDPAKAIFNAYTYLKPGGEFRLMLYHRKSTKVARILMRHLLDFRRKSVDQIVAMESEAQSGCPITYTHTKKTAKELLESCGFQVDRMEVEHIFPYDWRAYREYVYRLGFPWNILPKRVHRWLEQRLGWHLLIWARKV